MGVIMMFNGMLDPQKSSQRRYITLVYYIFTAIICTLLILRGFNIIQDNLILIPIIYGFIFFLLLYFNYSMIKDMTTKNGPAHFLEKRIWLILFITILVLNCASALIYDAAIFPSGLRIVFLKEISKDIFSFVVFLIVQINIILILTLRYYQLYHSNGGKNE